MTLPACCPASSPPPSSSAAGLDPYNADTALNCATDIVSFTGSFHGRTMGALALTYKVGWGWLDGSGWELCLSGGSCCCTGRGLDSPHLPCCAPAHPLLPRPPHPPTLPRWPLQDQYRTPFQPVMPGNVMVPYM